MFDPDIQRKALSLIMGFIIEFSGTPAEPEVQCRNNKPTAFWAILLPSFFFLLKHFLGFHCIQR